jgi:hypothetical protein
MKRFMNILLALTFGVFALTAEEFTTGGVFVHSTTGNLHYNLVGQTTAQTEKAIVGKTYRVEADVVEFVTSNQNAVLGFSTGLLVKVKENTEFSIDAFNQLVVNYEDQPSILQAQYAITTLSLLKGEVEIVAPQVDEYSQCAIQTPLANILLTGGKYGIRADPKFIIINVIEGKAVVQGSDNQMTDIVKGSMGLVIPFPGRPNEIMVTQKGIAAGEISKFATALKELEGVRENVIFAVIDKKVVGIRLK